MLLNPSVLKYEISVRESRLFIYLFIYKLYHVLPVKNEIDIFSFISRILGCRLYF